MIYKGHDGGHLTRRTNMDQRFAWTYTKATEVLDLRSASLARARRIREAHPDKEIVVLYSGGMDSEWILETFYEAGIEASALVIDHGYNVDDVASAKVYLAERGIRTYWHKEDLRSFYDSGEYEELCWASQTAEPGYAITYKAMLQRDTGSRLFIHGHDEPQVRADNSGPIRGWKFAYIERTAAVDMFLAHYKVPNEMWFDANLMASYVTAPAWLKIYANEYPLHIWDPEMIKHDLLPPAFPGLKLRPKRHGFEDGLRMVVETRHRWLAKVRELSGIDWMQITYEPVDSVLRKLGCK